MDDTAVRINLSYSCFGCQKCPPPFTDKEDNEKVPAILLEKGLKVSQWQSEVENLWGINRDRWTCCSTFRIFLLGMFTCCLYNSYSLKRKQSIAIDVRLQNWQRLFNEKLEPLGIFCKTKSHCNAVYTKDGKQRYYYRWISFALTPTEIEKLKSEPHLTGDIENGTCCTCTDETDMCMHPN